MPIVSVVRKNAGLANTHASPFGEGALTQNGQTKVAKIGCKTVGSDRTTVASTTVAVHLIYLLEEKGFPQTSPIVIKIDSTAAIAIANGQGSCST